jgi:regulatory protein
MGVKVTGIKTDPANGSRRIVTLEDGSEFSLHRELLVKHGLRLGVEIEKGSIEETAHEDELRRARDYAYNLLVCRDYTSQQMARKLAAKGFSVDVAGVVIGKLQKIGYIRDDRYARNWVQSRMRNNPRGRSMLKYELLSRGINKETIDSVLDEMDISVEYDSAIRAARKQMKHYSRLREVVARRRLYGFLTRRGFEVELVKKVIDKVLEENKA